MLPRRQPPPEKLDPADPPLTPRPRGDMSGSGSRSRGQYARDLAAPHPGRRPAIAGSRSPLTSHSVGRPTVPARPGGVMSRGSWYAAMLLSLCAAPLAQAQNREVTGKVVNATTKEAVPYATVSVVGGIQAAQANERGEFRIVVPPSALTLGARAIGYKRGQVRVTSDQSSVEIALERDILRLEAVLVTGEATGVESKNAAVAVRNLTAERLSTVPAQSAEQALQGKVPGALINMNSGAPGGGGQIQIRGVTTILGNGQRLFAVEGWVISNDQIASGANTITNAAFS